MMSGTPRSFPGDKDAAQHLATGFKSFIAPVHPAMVTNPNNREIGVGVKAVNAYDLAPDDVIDYGSVS
jgi:hypothetical protein